MNNPILFLDIDGVGNSHSFNKVSQSCPIDARNVEHLNRIIAATGAHVVLSSAWRYMLSEMTLKGFAYMLRVCGVTADLKIVGATALDECCPFCDGPAKIEKRCAACGEAFESPDPQMTQWSSPCCESGVRADYRCQQCGKPGTRGDQIARYLQHSPADRYVVIDDLDLGISDRGHPFVRTDSATGLTEADADQAIEILKGKGAVR